MTAHALWLRQGHYDFRNQKPSYMQAVRSELSRALGLADHPLRIASWPVGPRWRYTYWWREGKSNYAEAQFFASMAQEYPVLSLGVSVEKGYEGRQRAKGELRMDRRSWDWPADHDACNLMMFVRTLLLPG